MCLTLYDRLYISLTLLAVARAKRKHVSMVRCLSNNRLRGLYGGWVRLWSTRVTFYADGIISIGRQDLSKILKQKFNTQIIQQLLPPESRDHIKNWTVSFHYRDWWGPLLSPVDKEISYTGNSGLTWIDAPATTPMVEVWPHGLVARCRQLSEVDSWSLMKSLSCWDTTA